MATISEVPLRSAPQEFDIVLSGIVYHLRFLYCSGWIMDILDGVSDAPLACGIPLVTGSDLLEEFSHLGIGGSMYVATDGDPYALPTFENLGTLSHLYYVTNP
jgi:hypothetical protein